MDSFLNGIICGIIYELFVRPIVVKAARDGFLSFFEKKGIK